MEQILRSSSWTSDMGSAPNLCLCRCVNIHIYIYIWWFPSMEVPRIDGLSWKIPSITGLSRGTPISGNPHVYIYIYLFIYIYIYLCTYLFIVVLFVFIFIHKVSYELGCCILQLWWVTAYIHTLQHEPTSGFLLDFKPIS